MKRMIKQTGLTLIELLVVIAILLMLATVFQYGMSRLKVQSKVRAVERLMGIVDEALTEYESARASYPEVVFDPNNEDRVDQLSIISGVYQELSTVPEARMILDRADKHWKEQHFDEPNAIAPLQDPWGTPFGYHWQEGEGDVFPLFRSYGPDRIYNTDDDILNR